MPVPHTMSDDVNNEAARRRTFAVISHPDAGKSTLTEALALHAHAIAQAGAVHGKGSRRGVVSDWNEMEQARGISITAAALQFTVGDVVLNLLDTPGHADFSEDTYRVLSAVDCAVMLLDSAKGLEPQTLKLFEACRARATPVITVINKWDRPGREPLELLDEISDRLGIHPTPLNWPVGIAGDFRGVTDPDTGGMTEFNRTPGGATIAVGEALDADEEARRHGEDWERAAEEFELLASSGHTHDQEGFLAARTKRPFQTKYAQSVFGRERETIDEAYPGDVVGLVNAHALLVGDTLYDSRPVTYPGLPRFTPEHFAIFSPRDSGRGKQFRRGIELLDQEGIVQVLVSDRRGAQAPVLAAVGPMQFEVAAHRLEQEFGAAANQEMLQYSVARRVAPEAAAVVNRQRGAEVLERTDGVVVALFNDKWRMRTIASELPVGSLPPMFGDDDGVGP